MSCVYGPVPSRRLGSSLGLDVIPPYTCTFDCIYCQLERTAQKVSGVNELDRYDFPATDEVVSEVREALGKYDDIDYIAFSGSGEPTLNPNLGTIVSQLRKITDLPIALITNSSLLTEGKVLESAQQFDLALPSLDVGNQKSFRIINRPAKGFDLEKIVSGIRRLGKSSVTLWLETMLLNSKRFGTNASPEALGQLAKKVELIDPQNVHLNTPVRPPVEEVKPLSAVEMRRAKRDLQGDLPSDIDIEIIAKRSQSSSQLLDDQAAVDEIRKLLKIRPCTSTDIADSTGLNVNEVSKQLERLLEKGELKRQRREDQVYYRLKED
ncbi:radical SAM protein [Candidatus Bipolaricaulota bacterium]|nr:radical SAM protein [Candidatus Bipolaricaulota bacterium]